MTPEDLAALAKHLPGTVGFVAAVYLAAKLLSPVFAWVKERIESRDAFVEGLLERQQADSEKRDTLFLAELDKRDKILADLTAAIRSLEARFAAAAIPPRP